MKGILQSRQVLETFLALLFFTVSGAPCGVTEVTVFIT